MQIIVDMHRTHRKVVGINWARFLTMLNTSMDVREYNRRINGRQMRMYVYDDGSDRCEIDCRE